MMDERATGWLKSNRFLPLLLVAAGFASALSGCGPAEESPGAVSGESAAAGQDALRSEFEQARARNAAPEAAPREEKTTDEVIAEHTAALEGDLEPDAAAARLSALGNLHRQKKQDYTTAARYYEEIIERYPEWPGIKGVYHQLMSCYSQLDDQASLRLLYRKMVEVFPPESNEYQFAKDALGE